MFFARLTEAGRIPDNVQLPRDYQLVEEALPRMVL